MRALGVFFLWPVFLDFNSYLRHSLTLSEIQSRYIPQKAHFISSPFLILTHRNNLHSWLLTYILVSNFQTPLRNLDAWLSHQLQHFCHPNSFVSFEPEIRILPISHSAPARNAHILKFFIHHSNLSVGSVTYSFDMSVRFSVIHLLWGHHIHGCSHLVYDLGL